MISKKMLLLVLPLLVIIPLLAGLFSFKDTNAIIRNAELKSRNLTTYIITADVIMSINVMGSDMQYVSNTTTAAKNGNYYTQVISQEPFTGVDVITEQFIIDSGNYSCTNAYLRSFCIRDNITGSLVNYGMDYSNLSVINYLGVKKVNDKYCDVLYSKFNVSDLDSLVNNGVIDNETLSGVKDAFMYSCIDAETGLALESLFGMSGVSNYGSIMMDIGVNITRRLNSFTADVPDSLFILPYNVITNKEFEAIINETMVALNQTAEMQ